MVALDALLEQQEKDRALLMHTNAVVWAIGRGMSGGRFIEPYHKMVAPKVNDTRTAEEIVDDMAAQIRKRIEQRRLAP